MVKLTIQRRIKNDVCTTGIFRAISDQKEGTVTGYTLEPPDKNNQRNVSCILPGEYKAKPWQSPRFGRTIRLEDKNGRSNILIHIGNYPQNTQGCILPGKAQGKNVVWQSGEIMKELMDFVADDDVTVIIKDCD